jgi:DNA-binding response OmpR family regulator
VDRSIQSGSRARLLVIEDADDAREMLKFLLEIKGYVVDTAPDGYEGIALARARSPSVAVIDIGLPGMDGWSVATTLRREFDDRIRLIAYTSWGRAEDRARSAAAGFDAHLVKPIGVGHLLQTISHLLQTD